MIKSNPRKFLLLTVLVCLMITGCTTKMKIVDGRKYTQTFGSNEWHDEGEVKPVDQNASKPEESVGYAAGQAVGTVAVGATYILTLPIRAVENIVKPDSNTSKNNPEQNEYTK